MNNDKIRKTINALLAKAASTTYPAEADAFEAKARELIQKHGLTADDLTAGELGRTVEEYPGRVNGAGWLVVLWCEVAERLGVFCAYSPGRSGRRGTRAPRPLRFNLYGRTADAERTAYTVRYIESRIEEAAKEHRRENPGVTRSELFDFRVSAANAVAARMDELVAEVAPDKAPDPLAVVVAGAAGRYNEAEAYAKRTGPGFSTSSTRSAPSDAGAAAGASISVRKGVASTGRPASGPLLLG